MFLPECFLPLILWQRRCRKKQFRKKLIIKDLFLQKRSLKELRTGRKEFRQTFPVWKQTPQEEKESDQGHSSFGG